ncbi:apoptotic chromatin condensation inducer 1b [Girardinichthys multiradiatus]|uniref:apoptotic chromatin condensation inducer 1b n=1 Tax=Girardinichthys multiradiatus TaxID=208333 RepID=UPI001FAB8192|nr:apoptotic chromatin condensation inducer 1b [Girardinichthys multiradiatus]
MADKDITLDGKPLQSLRVADLKAALEQRNLPKSGQKNTLIKRLKGALMLENLQRSSSSHSGLQPNSQIGEEMCQNSFIKQYLAQQQELLRQRLAKEAQQEEEADESPTGPEEDEDQSEDNDSPPFISKHQGSLNLASGSDVGGENSVIGHGPAPMFHHRESNEDPRGRKQRASFQQGHKEPPASSPPRAVASFLVHVVGQPDSQGCPPTVAPGQEKEAATLSSPRTPNPVLNLSRSAQSSSENHVQDDSDEDDDDDDDSDDDEDWGPGSGGARRRKAAVPSKHQVAPSMSSAAARSKRKLQPPQHIPPPQVHDTPMQLRHPTPPPSPPPNLFPLPDTPKQSPPDDQEREAPRDARLVSFPLPATQRQDSDSSSGSSSPEPPVKRRSGPLSLLMHKMESEEATSSPGFSGETAHSIATCSSESPLQSSETKTQQEIRETEEDRQLKEGREREQQQKLEREGLKTQEQEKKKKRLEEEREKERKHLEEERKQRQKEEQEKEKRSQEEEKEKKHKEEEKRREEQRLKEEEEKKQEKVRNDRRAAAEEKDSGSSSDSDSKSESSDSHSSSSSSSSSRDKMQPASQLKKAAVGQEAEGNKTTKFSKDSEKPILSKREVSEPSTAAVTEVEPDSESSMAQQPASGAEPESSESRMEESTTPKAFAARKISLTGSKASPASTDGGAGESETGGAAGRKRRWGSSTAVTVKKPSISITTDSLKSLIPDIKVNQEVVVDLHPEEPQMSGDEENSDTGRSDPDQGLKIRRTVTQVVPSESQENGQTNVGEDMEKTEGENQHKTSREKKKSGLSDETSETQMSVSLDGEAKKVTPSDSLVRRSISQQKSGVSVTIDDPVRTTRQPSPPQGKVSNIIHVINLVRPFTLLQLKELLNRTGSVVEEGFWIDKIKSHCYVTYATTEEAVATRTALHGVKWPPSNPKVLSIDFCEQDELDYHKGIRKPEKDQDHAALAAAPPQPRLPPLMPVRDRDKDQDRDRERDRDRDRGVRDLWAERQREMERRERARGEREWDRDKVREFARPGEEGRRSRSRERERRRRERAKSKEKKTDKKEKGDEPPAKLLDDLFLKTKAAPCIYWLPLTEEQANQRVLDRVERQKERERRRKEQEEEEDKKRDEEKKERLKAREKDSGAAASGVASGRGADTERERNRGRDREGDKRRDSSHRSRRPSPVSGGGRRSRSRSNPRDRRR